MKEMESTKPLWMRIKSSTPKKIDVTFTVNEIFKRNNENLLNMFLYNSMTKHFEQVGPSERKNFFFDF